MCMCVCLSEGGWGGEMMERRDPGYTKKKKKKKPVGVCSAGRSEGVRVSPVAQPRIVVSEWWSVRGSELQAEHRSGEGCSAGYRCLLHLSDMHSPAKVFFVGIFSFALLLSLSGAG